MASRRARGVLDEDLLRSTLRELLERQQQPAEDLTGPLEAQLDRTRQQIGRLVDALASGAGLPSVRGRLAELEREGSVFKPSWREAAPSGSSLRTSPRQFKI
jgi:hypothetical protein